MQTFSSRPEHVGARANGDLWRRRVATFACLLLLALLTVVQVGHVHPTTTDADHCPVCVVMHSAAPVAAVAPDPPVATASQPIPLPVFHAAVRRWHYTLFNRPPPAHA